jgi:hypothetical protein
MIYIVDVNFPFTAPFYEEPAESPISTPKLAKEYPYIMGSQRPLSINIKSSVSLV